MLTPTLEQRLNDHLNLEFASAHLYLSMSAFFETQNLPGFANWMYVQYQEELQHSLKFFRYINDREGRVVLSQVPQPENKWQDPLDVARATLAHEKMISAAINELVGASMDERDFATQNFLQWFISEQVEEESTAADLVAKLEMLGESRQGLYLLDRELAERQMQDPATV